MTLTSKTSHGQACVAPLVEDRLYLRRRFPCVEHGQFIHEVLRGAHVALRREGVGAAAENFPLTVVARSDPSMLGCGVQLLCEHLVSSGDGLEYLICQELLLSQVDRRVPPMITMRYRSARDAFSSRRRVQSAAE